MFVGNSATFACSQELEGIVALRLPKIEMLTPRLWTVVSIDRVEDRELLLPDSIGQLIQLTILKMVNCPELKFLPDSLKNLTQLIGLKINKCGIEYLPQDLKMNNLKPLEVTACPLRELPFRRVEGEIETELNRLDKCMFHGGLCPNLQGVCPNLQFLSLNNCKELRQIGRLCGLPKLEVLCCDGRENIEKLSGVDTLISLTVLDVSGCVKLEKIEGLGQLTKLPGVERSRLLSIFLSNCPKLQLPKPRGHSVHSEIYQYHSSIKVGNFISITHLESFVKCLCKLERISLCIVLNI